jgi:hypothetical protein
MLLAAVYANFSKPASGFSRHFKYCLLFIFNTLKLNMPNDLVHGIAWPGNTKGGNITVLLPSSLTGLESAV